MTSPFIRGLLLMVIKPLLTKYRKRQARTTTVMRTDARAVAIRLSPVA